MCAGMGHLPPQRLSISMLLCSSCTRAHCIERRTVELTRELRGEHHSKLRAKAGVAEIAADAVARRVLASANRT